MKNRSKLFLFFINIFLFMFLFEQSVSSLSIQNNTENIKCLNENEQVNNNNSKVIYLTFDDGPSNKITNKVLDILKENDVKATFFLIGSQIDGQEDVVKRIYNEGNSIGLHTFSHKFRKIYSNEDNFINEMMECRDKINNVIGISPEIIRFPGGSRKHLSKDYLNRLHDNNFKVYDWNVETSDGLNPKISPYNMFRRAVKESKNLQRIILLMHCDCRQKNTCEALPDIIKYYKLQGYQFKTITEDTPELYFPIKTKK